MTIITYGYHHPFKDFKSNCNFNYITSFLRICKEFSLDIIRQFSYKAYFLTIYKTKKEKL